MIDEQAIGYALNLNSVWARQGISTALSQQLEEIAKAVSAAITVPPVSNMNVGEWCKKEDCWNKVLGISIPLSPALHAELLSKSAIQRVHDNAAKQAVEDAVINAVVEVFNLGQTGTWKKLSDWSNRYSQLVGKEADLVRLATQGKWIPSDKQAAVLMKVLSRLEQEGFRRN